MENNISNAVNSESSDLFFVYGNGCEIQGREVNGVRIIESVKVKYETEANTRFEMYGNDLNKKLEISGSLDYVRYWLRDKLRKLGNGEIKVIHNSSKERDWRQEEKIKKQMWEDIEVNEYPKGIGIFPHGAIVCTVPEQQEYRQEVPDKGCLNQ